MGLLKKPLGNFKGEVNCTKNSSIFPLPTIHMIYNEMERTERLLPTVVDSGISMCSVSRRVRGWVGG